MGRWLPCLVASICFLFGSLFFLFKLIFSANFDVLGWDVLFNRNFIFFAVLFFVALVIAGVGAKSEGSKVVEVSKVEKSAVNDNSVSKASIVKGVSSGVSGLSEPKYIKPGSLIHFTGAFEHEGLTIEVAKPIYMAVSYCMFWERKETVPDDSPSSSGDGEGEFSLFEGKVGRGKK